MYILVENARFALGKNGGQESAGTSATAPKSTPAKRPGAPGALGAKKPGIPGAKGPSLPLKRPFGN